MNLSLHPIAIVNKRAHLPTAGAADIYIGRGSPLGNPFSHLPSTSHPTKHCVSREDAVDSFRFHLVERLSAGDVAIRGALNEIFRAAQIGPVNLICYCAPAKCHGEVIREVILTRVAEMRLRFAGAVATP